jgi:hypothetical protein
MRRWTVSFVVVMAACSTAPAGTTVDPATAVETMREQIHAATGHDPDACTSMIGDIAEIHIGDPIAMPDCIILQEQTELIVSNDSDIDQRFAVSDPPSVNVRNDIYVLEIPPGGQGSIPEVGERTQSGVYPFYIRGGEPFSGFLVVVP